VTFAMRVRDAVALLWPAIVLLAVWWIWIVAAHVPALVAPSPVAVVRELFGNPALYVRSAAVTAGVAAAGLAIGMIAAMTCALLVRLTPFAEGLLTAPALLVQSTPLVAMLPLIARIFGYGEASVIAGAAAVVIIGAGLRSAPPGTRDVFIALGASRFDTLRYLSVPASRSSIFTALRISAANSILAALVAEYLLGQAGLGAVFADAQSSLLTARAWSASLVATALSVAAFAATRRLETE
jgi:putative hydroxymethylpyrimidine transport system permease protein